MMSRSHGHTIYQALGRESVHPFPARMAPGIALDLISETKRPLRILDPMMGSGTVLALARSRGHRAYGVDIDPLAVLISRVWTRSADPQAVLRAANEVLSAARTLFSSISPSRAYPLGADEETLKFVTYWFDTRARRQLAALATAIGRLPDNAVRDMLWCSFSRLIITKQAGASLAMDLAHSRPHKVFLTAPIQPFDRFVAAAERVATNCLDRRAPNRGPEPRTYQGDARHLPIANASIDLVLTSPPYLNAIDYMRCSKFSLVWMGYQIASLRALRSESVGSEAGTGLDENTTTNLLIQSLRLRPRLAKRHEAILARYVGDMRRAVSEVARVLAPGGKAVYVIGENTIRGTYVPNSRILQAIASEQGLLLERRRVRTLPANRRYLPPPVVADAMAMLNGRMRREVILTFAHQEM
jgi:SAM-dependent methyltransferase